MYILLTTFALSISQAQMIESSLPKTGHQNEKVFIFGTREQLQETPGSASVINQSTLEEEKHTDINRVLKSVPGVNIQEEDGYGLRPNIGFRGAHPHRSKKITILEDGILIGPAPYSAPAAYYFPTTLKMQKVEVFKGPTSVGYGPNSIGGAINMVTKEIPKKSSSTIDLSYGQLETYRAQTGNSYKYGGFLVDATLLKTDGHKQLPGGENTGFEKRDFLIKGSIHTNKSTEKFHRLSAKINFSNEDSNETYLGLTEKDFSTNPWARYASSSNDKMKWDHQQYQLKYDGDINSFLSIDSTAYYHKFERNWSKLSGFQGGEEIPNVMSSPIGRNEHLFNILKGLEDSESIDGGDNLVIGNNKRSYYSTGLQTNFYMAPEFDSNIEHEVKLGIRLHQDQIKRDHSEDTFSMMSGKLSPTLAPTRDGTVNKDTAKALTLTFEDKITYQNLTLTVSSRLESVQTKRTTRNKNIPEIENSDTVFIPGMGLYYKINEGLGLFGGLNKGVTLVGPGQDDSIKPEESINYELGLRYNDLFYFETVGFYSDYQNIKGTCSFSSGCNEVNLDQEYNGGKARILGIEQGFGITPRYKKFEFPLSLNYTYTQAMFMNENESGNQEWGVGTIVKGDPLPYIPKEQYSISTGVKFHKFSSKVNFNWQSKVYDQAVQENRKEIPARGVVDLVSTYQYSKSGKAYFKVDNLLDNEYVVSLRPYGARPGKPRMLTFGLKHTF